ncbi:hypothetical protein CRM22_001941 [Opisthorchis felineus]|uniref:Uncharacterized protein n=1 Tax=Opisthorchis felineus TaxID=147828 RepID=A0A4S2M8N0_OPIFE|nr:hypothetical protein CRM22_001941 [Opisthorchis felineus]
MPAGVTFVLGVLSSLISFLTNIIPSSTIYGYPGTSPPITPHHPNFLASSIKGKMLLCPYLCPSVQWSVLPVCQPNRCFAVQLIYTLVSQVIDINVAR